jgi:hypothetical protein
MLVRPLRLLRPTSFLVAAGFVAYAGCSSTAAETVAVTHPTMIEISPESFLGDVPCATNGPGLKRYVATLFDTNEGGAGGSAGGASVGGAAGGSAGVAPFQLPSSAPTSCVAAVGFGFVVAGRRYRVEVDGFDTEDLTPRAAGSRQMVTGDDGALAVPAWSTSCERAIAVDSTIVRADQCGDGFIAKEPNAQGSLNIELTPLLGTLRCGSAVGEVEELSVALSVPGEDEPRVQTVACMDDARAVFDELAPGQAVAAYVTAFSADGSSAFAGASCSARTQPAAVVDAQCSPLSQVGSVRVDLKAALALLGLSCAANQVKSLQIKIPGEEAVQVVTPPGCLHPFDHGFAPGAAALTISAMSAAEGAELGSLTCHAEAAPGRLVVAECEQNPAK